MYTPAYSPTALLDAVVKILTADKGEVLVSAWFSNAEAVSLKNNILTVSVPSELIRDTLNKRFIENVSEILEDLTGEPVRPEYICREELDLWRLENDESVYSAYTFERFIVGPNNKFAQAAALAVASNPAATYNPLFIYGASGLGKTHLLYAIAGEMQKRRGGAVRVVYRKAEDFTNELVESIRRQAMMDFREKYRKADLLLIDDVQFIAGRQQTEEEFFHTFNALFEAGKQVVLTSDRPPKEIKSLAERLVTRFEAGLLADIQSPDLETRIALVMEKSELFGLKMPKGVAEFVASSITGNVRELEGAVRKIAAMHSMLGMEVNVTMAQEAIRDIFKDRPGLNPTPQLILDEVCAFFSITPEKLRSNSHARDVVLPRQVAAYLIREMTNPQLSLPDTGKFLDQHHTTVLYAINKLEKQMEENESLRNTIDDLRSNIRSR
ncbi:MAG: chromosomal replication initiator protein DnaA [Clostridia bacterium]|nr:chromosomal replication initiator protein DnaA [Clostridia bacterium]